jgi:hypothetical protein
MSSMNAIKTLFSERSDQAMSLKQFVRSLQSSKSEVERALAKEWFAHKAGTLDKAAQAARLEKKGGQLAEIRIKVRASRRKSSSSGK